MNTCKAATPAEAPPSAGAMRCSFGVRALLRNSIWSASPSNCAHQHSGVTVNAFMLRAAIHEGEHRYELTLFRDGRAIVKGTQEPGVAQCVCALCWGMR